MNDVRIGALFQCRDVALECFRDEAVCRGRLQNVGDLGAIARDAAIAPQGGEGNEAAIVGEDAGQGSGAALDGFHLEDHRSADAALGKWSGQGVNTPPSSPSGWATG